MYNNIHLLSANIKNERKHEVRFRGIENTIKILISYLKSLGKHAI